LAARAADISVPARISFRLRDVVLTDFEYRAECDLPQRTGCFECALNSKYAVVAG
jgi:hypothetical protein